MTTNIYYEEIKDMAVEAIKPTTTKSFVNRSCQIRSIEGDCVTLTVKSRFLLEIAKKQQVEIEEGFSKVFGNKITVLIVQSTEEN